MMVILILSYKQWLWSCNKNTTKELNNNKGLKSNDKHILAHAKVGKVTLIVTRDKKLQQDFKNIYKGNIYSKAKHEHLLQEVECS